MKKYYLLTGKETSWKHYYHGTKWKLMSNMSAWIINKNTGRNHAIYINIGILKTGKQNGIGQTLKDIGTLGLS